MAFACRLGVDAILIRLQAIDHKYAENARSMEIALWQALIAD